MVEEIHQRGKVTAPQVPQPQPKPITPPQKKKKTVVVMSENKGTINEGKVVPAKVPQPPVRRMQDGKVVAPKVPRPTPSRK